MKKNIFISLLLFFNIVCTEKLINLAGQHLSLELLEKLKHASIAELIKNQTNQDNLTIEIKRYLFWHQKHPTTGLLKNDIPNYPYIPHYYSLGELAPKKGAGIIVALLDTGVAAFEIENQSSLKNHPDLIFPQQCIHDLLNVSNMSSFDTLVNFVQHVIPSNKIPLPVLENEIISWINEYCINNSTNIIERFFKKYAFVGLLSEDGNLTHQGKKVLNAITQGRHGIMPHGKIRFFTPITLKSHQDKKVILEFLPACSKSNEKKSLLAAHGTHIYGLINAQPQCSNEGIVGLAPNATSIMIKMCKDDGTCDVETLMKALKTVQHYKPDIVNLSLKIETDISKELLDQLQKLLDSFSYVIVASGNVLNNVEKKSIQSFLARCNNITFDVGSFSFDGQNSYPISSYSYYEQGIGPKLVAPGFNIMSTSDNAGYLFLSGTSMASALITGFLSLLLSEFKNDFTQDQILEVCYASTFRMHNDEAWNTRSLLGVLDMRTALFVLHICRTLKKALNLADNGFQFDKKFNRLIKAILLVLFEMPRKFAEQNSIQFDFVHSFADFCNNIPLLQKNSYKKQTLESVLSSFVKFLIEVIEGKNVDTNNVLAPYISQTLFVEIRNLLLDSLKCKK